MEWLSGVMSGLRTAAVEHERVLTLPHETQTVSDAISILTPAGAALLGLKVGNEIRWPHQGHFLRLQLLSVSRT